MIQKSNLSYPLHKFLKIKVIKKQMPISKAISLNLTVVLLFYTIFSLFNNVGKLMLIYLHSTP